MVVNVRNRSNIHQQSRRRGFDWRARKGGKASRIWCHAGVVERDTDFYRQSVSPS